MSPEQPAVAVSRSPTETDEPRGVKRHRGDGDGASSHHSDRAERTPYPPSAVHSDTKARDIVRLFQCRLCSLPFREVVTLPCGRSICRQCLPETHARVNITYPSLPERLHGFLCPFPECAKEHALGDCGQDVILNKAAQFMRDEVERGRLEAVELHLSTHIMSRDPWEVAGISSLKAEESSSKVVGGGKLVATWALAEEGGLDHEAEVSYGEIPTPTDGYDPVEFEMEVLRKAQMATRSEMDCQVCYALFYDPLTTGCGHTFCRSCLHRILDHSRYCPICRRQLAINPLLNRSSCPSNESISKIIQTFWWDELVARRDAIAEEAGSHDDFDTPLFLCTLSFPLMPTFLHVFEARYRLMVRRVLDGNRTFGMVLPRRAPTADDAPFYEYGTLLRVVNVQFYPDGRSLIETIGLSRFKVLRHGMRDGYMVGEVERIDDVSLEEEEAVEAAEVTPEPSAASATSATGAPEDDTPDASRTSSEDRLPTTQAEVDTMSTQNMMRYATGFVERMRTQSAPWLTERMLSIYGECPDDPAVFPWWFASMFPVRDMQKYRLLETASVRNRLKTCCTWIVDWETSRW